DLDAIAQRQATPLAHVPEKRPPARAVQQIEQPVRLSVGPPASKLGDIRPAREEARTVEAATILLDHTDEDVRERDSTDEGVKLGEAQPCSLDAGRKAIDQLEV